MSVENRPEKLSLVLFSGDYDRVHYALVMACASAAANVPVTLFFTMEACRALVAKGPDGQAGWRSLPASGGRTGAEVDGFYARRDVAEFEDMIEACAAFGVKFIVCEMALRAIGLEFEDLRDDVPLELGGVVGFLNDASKDGSMLFV